MGNGQCVTFEECGLPGPWVEESVDAAQLAVVKERRVLAAMLVSPLPFL